jgi:hypothetical protein
MSKYIFRKAIKSIFGEYEDGFRGIICDDEYTEDVVSKWISFRFSDNVITLKQLVELSLLLGTDEIDFSGRTDDCGTDITPATQNEGTVCCRNVRFPAP